MSVTFTARMDSQKDKDFINEALGKIAERYPECNMKRYALLKLIELYNADFSKVVYKEVPDSISKTIKEVDCPYLKHLTGSDPLQPEAFYCYEKFHTIKKEVLIAKSHISVIGKCNLCRLGKHDKEQYKIHEQLRKKNIKNILDLRDILIKLTHEATLAQIFICKGELFDNHKLIISADGIHLQCPLELDDKGKPLEMLVVEHCYEQINPYDMNPPCKHLIDPHVRVRPPDKVEEILEELKQLEHQPTEEIKSEAKNIDVEVIESDEEKQEDK